MNQRRPPTVDARRPPPDGDAGLPLVRSSLVARAVPAHRLERLAVATAGYAAYVGTRVPPISAVGYAAAAVIVLPIALARVEWLPRRRQRRRVTSGSSTTSSPSSRTT